MWNGAQEIRGKLFSGRFVTGFAATLSDPTVSEMAACAGYDFVFIDAEHPPMDRQTIYHHLIAAQGGGAAAMVRVYGDDPHWLKAILDMGPDGVIFPFVHNADIARRCVAACAYPDVYIGGMRGQGPQRAVRWGFGETESYLRQPDKYLLKIMQIESYEGWKNIDDILAIPGVDGIYIGPADISRSLNAKHSHDAPPLALVCADVFRKTRAAGKWMGAPLPSDSARLSELLEMGAQWGVCGIDSEILAGSMRSNLALLESCTQK